MIFVLGNLSKKKKKEEKKTYHYGRQKFWSKELAEVSLLPFYRHWEIGDDYFTEMDSRSLKQDITVL